jgi:hypothetical protein
MTASARTFRQRIGEWKSQCRLCPASNTGFGNPGPGFPALSASLTVPTSLLSWPREALHPTSVPAEAVSAAMAMEIGKRAIGSPLVCGLSVDLARARRGGYVPPSTRWKATGLWRGISRQNSPGQIWRSSVFASLRRSVAQPCASTLTHCKLCRFAARATVSDLAR